MTASRYQGWAADDEGNVIPLASITVKHEDSGLTVNPIWSVRTELSTKTNPFTADANGYFFFYAPPGRYRIETSDGVTTNTSLRDVQIGLASEYGVGTSAGLLVDYSSFSAVAFNGLYSSLTGTPTLGTMAALDTGTTDPTFRTNTQNDGRFLRIANNLNDLESAISARANLDLSDIYAAETTIVSLNGITAGEVPVQRAGGYEDSGLTFDGNGAATFASTVSVANATAGGHAVNRDTGDGRYGQLGTANTWTGNQSVTGAGSFTTGVTVASGQDVLSNFVEGTYTATLTPASGSITLDSGNDALRYHRVGGECLVSGIVVIDSVSTPAGAFDINLPFASADLPELSDYGAGAVFIQNSVSKNCNDFAIITFGGVSIARIFRADASALTEDSGQQIQAGVNIYFSFSYPVA